MKNEKTINYILLGLLAHEPASGYDLKKRIDVSFSHFWPLSYGQIYPSLKTLLAEGYIEFCGSNQKDGPARKLYRTTAEGLSALQEYLQRPELSQYFRNELLVKLFFGGEVNPEVSLRHLNQFQAECQQKLALFSAFEMELDELIQADPDHLFINLSVSFGRQSMETYIRWAQDAERKIMELNQERFNA